MGAYLDWNATTPLRVPAREAFLAAVDSSWGNPASVHAWGQEARHSLDQSRLAIARALGCRASELVFTSGGTESNALAITSALPAAGEAVVSAIEHSSVLRTVAHQCQRLGSRWHRLAVGPHGAIDPASLVALLNPRTALVCLQLANNEIGTVQDIPALARLVRQHAPQALTLCDACQALGKIPVRLPELGVDLASGAGHKFGAPKGVGLLYVRQGIRLAPLQHGGRQQQDRRSGTEDAALVAALSAALQASQEQLATEPGRQQRLLQRLWLLLQERLPGCRWIAQDGQRVPNTMSLAHPGCRREDLVARLDLAGFGVSPGAACMAGRGEPSHVIAALGLPEEIARSVIRISIGWSTTEAEIDAFAAAYAHEVDGVKAVR